MGCLRVDGRTYKRAGLERWAAVTFDAAVSGSIGSPSAGIAGYGDGLMVAAPASTRAASTLMSSAATGAGSSADWAGGVPGSRGGAAAPVGGGGPPARGAVVRGPAAAATPRRV